MSMPWYFKKRDYGYRLDFKKNLLMRALRAGGAADRKSVSLFNRVKKSGS
jgi:hypothetical protein